MINNINKRRFIIMLKIIYTEKGKAYSDFNLIENAQFIID